jgi:hypothetical protein
MEQNYACKDGYNETRITTESGTMIKSGDANIPVTSETPAPCENHGGLVETSWINDVRSKLTPAQKWGIIIGVSALAYFILHKAGSLKSI